MNRGNRLWWALLGLAFASGAMSSAMAQSGPVAIAVLPFEDRGSYGQDKEVFRALALGIPATIVSELRGHSELRLADRNRIAEALNREKVGPNARVDAATAARVAKRVGARYAVTGNFADFYGKFRLDARIVDAESGQIIKVVSNNDPKLQDRADLYRIIQMVNHKVLAEASPAALRGGSAETEARAIPTEALTQYSLGLLYESQGKSGKAGEYYQRALSALPDYSDAREGLRRVEGP
jgi:TolB-like protein